MPPDPPAEPTDAELARRVAVGPDPTGAFKMLFARHHGRLLAFLLARYRNVAEDVAQEAWLRVLSSLKTGPRAVPNFRAYLFQIARNLALDVHRRKQAGPLTADDDPPDPVPPTLDGLLDAERREVVRGCLKMLPPDQRDVIAAASGGEKPEETAGRLGVPRRLIDQRKSRALAALRECVQKHLP